MQIIYSNITRREDQELREKVLQTMKKQVLKKIIGQRDGSRLSKSCDAPFNGIKIAPKNTDHVGIL